MIKAKFGASVRAKSDAAQKNEVLLKILCHNLAVLVQSIYELKIEPIFWPKDETSTPSVSLGNLSACLTIEPEGLW